MTGYGKMNLAGMLLLPVAAAAGGADRHSVRAAIRCITVFALNLVPMLIGGLVSWLLLRGATRAGKGQGIALWPTAHSRSIRRRSGTSGGQSCRLKSRRVPNILPAPNTC